VKIEDDGVISRREVRRMIPVSDSPLTDAVNALIAGPSEGEIRSGLVSLVPRGTKLLGITLRGSTAIINLSDAFMYNHYGNEGFSAQLKQIVYTATSFPSVQDVQILVEGKAKDYLGGEGVYIGKPLSRNSF
jgi:germination protein M